MSTTQTPIGFRVQELFTRIVPGLLITIALFGPAIAYTEITSASGIVDFVVDNYIWLFGIISTIILGELVHQARVYIRPVPSRFRVMMYNNGDNRAVLTALQRRRINKQEAYEAYLESGDKEVLSRTQRYLSIPLKEGVREVGKGIFSRISNYLPWLSCNDDLKGYFTEDDYGKVITKFKKEVDIDEDFNHPRDLYYIFTNYMDTIQSSRTERYRMTYAFYQNGIWASNISIPILAIWIFVGTGLSKVVALILLFFVFLVAYTLIYILFIIMNIEDAYLTSLIIDFLSEIDQN